MANTKAIIEQPRARDNELAEHKRFHSGSERSKGRLKQLRYDPIGELVAEHHKLTALIKREEDIRDGAIVILNQNTLKVVSWRPDAMLKFIEHRIRIAEQLLRYGYGRVPEVNINENVSLPPLIINTTKKGEVYHTDGFINQDEDDGD